VQNKFIQSNLLPTSSRHVANTKEFAAEVLLHGKPIQIQIHPRALQQLARSDQSILVEMELYFSCLIRKQVRFCELDPTLDTQQLAVQVTPGLYLYFNPVTTKECRIAEVGNKPPVTSMPVVRPQAFVPHWLYIDYRANQWIGEFGY
jgi:hypothetical protein